MEPWRLWLAMALEAHRAARAAEQLQLWRSSVSRYYYAAFSATSAVLLYSGLIPPVDEEAWSHAQTPEMIREHYGRFVKSRDKRNRLSSDLSDLYKLRIYADYRCRERVDNRVVEARKRSSHVIKVSLDILPAE